MCVCSVIQSCLTLCDPWTVACQSPLSMGFPRQEYWSKLPFPPSGALHHPGIEPPLPVSPALAGGLCTTEPPKTCYKHKMENLIELRLHLRGG